jgi:uncharacterized protein with NRDE domain
MCTIVALHGLRSDLPLVVAANRDEAYARPATGAIQLAPGIVGGRDTLAGGTWMGVTHRGLVVGVTNQRTGKPPAPDKRSRGALVMAALTAGTLPAVRALLASTDARHYNPFNLLVGDGAELLVAYARDDVAEIHMESLSPGLWVLANDRIDSPEYPKTLRAAALVQPHVTAPWPELAAALRTMLADHTRPALAAVPPPAPDAPFSHELLRQLQALCIHTETYGTRSSSIVAVRPDRTVAAYDVANGRPCTTPFVDVRALLDAPR